MQNSSCAVDNNMDQHEPEAAESTCNTPSQHVPSEGNDDPSQVVMPNNLRYSLLKEPNNSMGEAPEPILLDAVWHGHHEVVRVLLTNGASPATPGSMGRLALHIAAERNDEVMARLLLRHGAPVDAADHRGTTALRLAAVSGAAKVVQALIDAGARLGYA
jgi:ankyrin repeat protein